MPPVALRATPVLGGTWPGSPEPAALALRMGSPHPGLSEMQNQDLDLETSGEHKVRSSVAKGRNDTQQTNHKISKFHSIYRGDHLRAPFATVSSASLVGGANRRRAPEPRTQGSRKCNFLQLAPILLVGTYQKSPSKSQTRISARPCRRTKK